jgi:thioredoxin-like negative regulator of GroEL
MKPRSSARAMAEELRPFDPDAFARSVKAELISGVTSRLDRLLRQTLVAHPTTNVPHLGLIIAETCLALGRTKQARHWLEQLARDVNPDGIARAISVAIRGGHADVALRLFDRLSGQAVPEPCECLALAQEAITLAVRLRLPRGRDGAWTKHLKLLRSAESLLVTSMQQPLTDALHEQTASSLESARKLLRTNAAGTR